MRIKTRKKYFIDNGKPMRRAHGAVHKAIFNGTLACLLNNRVKCADCKKRAERYDHRLYSRPLDVEPVCSGCNVKRGPAIDSVARRRSDKRRISLEKYLLAVQGEKRAVSFFRKNKIPNRSAKLIAVIARGKIKTAA